MSRQIGRAIVSLRLRFDLSIDELCAYFHTNHETWHKIENEYTDSPHLHEIYNSMLKYIKHRQQVVLDDI